MAVRVEKTELRVLDMDARLPFRYGSAVLTRVPHVLLGLDLQTSRGCVRGLAAEGLPPKWFTKNPAESFVSELRAMVEVIETACAEATEVGSAGSVFDLWLKLHVRQKARLGGRFPALLWGLGVSLVERAMMDAFCRQERRPFHRVLREGGLGFDAGRIHPELSGLPPENGLPLQPAPGLQVRQTVGLSDVIFERDVAPGDRVNDGLPQSLESLVRHYGLTHLKIKWSGDIDRDMARMHDLLRLSRSCDRAFRFTIDGNEQYRDLLHFRQAWDRFEQDPELRSMRRGLLFVEQPLARGVALDEAIRPALAAWPDHPPIILDESDDAWETCPRALELGYAGVSHKNCKGVFRSIANACLLARRRRENPQNVFILSGEDLANVGPLALLQDLAVAALLGLGHVERNGHHYFRGLSMYPLALQRQVTVRHGDLYAWCEEGFATLRLSAGQINLRSVNAAPFGCAVDMDPGIFTPLEEWKRSMVDRFTSCVS